MLCLRGKYKARLFACDSVGEITCNNVAIPLCSRINFIGYRPEFNIYYPVIGENDIHSLTKGPVV
jgi:hypothetical protein